MNTPRILFLDIETSLELVAVFQLGNNDWIDPSSLVTERYIICAGWKWADETKVHTISVLDDQKLYKKDPHDDSHVIKALHKILSEADVIVGHNLDNFDKPYIDTRIIYHDLSPLPPITSIDTYKIAKNKFRFNSNKLAYLSQFLKLGEKIKTTPGLWMDVLKGDSKAIKEMIIYNIQDVILLEKVFNKLVPYMPNHISRELFGQKGCPRCGSKSYQSRGVHRAITKIYQRYRCNSCKGWFRELKADKGSTRFRVL